MEILIGTLRLLKWSISLLLRNFWYHQPTLEITNTQYDKIVFFDFPIGFNVLLQIIQKRFDGVENFYRDWNDYKYGFGNKTGEYWLGNGYIFIMYLHTEGESPISLKIFHKKRIFGFILFINIEGNQIIYEIVQQGVYELRIDLTDFNNETRYALYKKFYIDDETNGYRLHLEGYEGTAGMKPYANN